MAAVSAPVTTRRGVPDWVLPAICVVALVVLWQIIGKTVYADSNTIPPPTAILEQMREDGWDFYWRNASATLTVAAKGWMYGNALAVGLALAAILVPFVEKPLLQLGLTSYCLPTVAIGSILVIVYGGGGSDTPKVILSAMQVFFITLVGAIVGLRNVDKASLDVVHAYGGNRLHQLFKVRTRACLPTLFGALKIAAPASVLGAIIGEYLGADTGLGVAMINSQQAFQVERTWALCLIATASAGATYALTSLVGRVLTPWAPRVKR
jgi:ABC-type nitrate/sulfonate/bicarbonate transport system permease component